MTKTSKSILITGCAGRIGQSLVETFKKEGYFVIGLDLKDSSIKELDVFVKTDLKRYAEEEDYRARIEEELRPHTQSLHVLINNAAVQRLGSFPSFPLKDWNETLSVNLTACMLLSQFCFPFLEQSKGSIINIGSIHQNLTKKNFVAYATSKSALVGFTKALSLDIGDRVRVNAISPAAIDTPMLRAGFDNDESKIDELRGLHPTGDIGGPDEVARLAVFISSSESLFLNGSNITLDGGISNVLNDL